MAQQNFLTVELEGRLDAGRLEELAGVFDSFSEDPDARSLVLVCRDLSGPDAGSTTPVEALELARLGQSLIALIEGAGKPVIAAISGEVLDGGFELALACHWRIATEDARLGFSNPARLPAFGGAARLAEVAGRSRALDIILTGRTLTATEAHSINIVNRLHPDSAQLIAHARDLTARLGRNAPLAVRFALEAVASGSHLPLDDALRLESALFALCFATRDVREGTAAFLEKRPPDFEGR